MNDSSHSQGRNEPSIEMSDNTPIMKNNIKNAPKINKVLTKSGLRTTNVAENWERSRTSNNDDLAKELPNQDDILNQENINHAMA